MKQVARLTVGPFGLTATLRSPVFSAAGQMTLSICPARGVFRQLLTPPLPLPGGRIYKTITPHELKAAGSLEKLAREVFEAHAEQPMAKRT